MILSLIVINIACALYSASDLAAMEIVFTGNVSMDIAAIYAIARLHRTADVSAVHAIARMKIAADIPFDLRAAPDLHPQLFACFLQYF